MKNINIEDLTEKVVRDITKILDYFHLSYNNHANRISLKCPIHSGDNREGCCIYLVGEKVNGCWSCWTSNCHETYGKSIFGFIQGLLSVSQNKKISREYAIEWTIKFLNCQVKEYDQDTLIHHKFIKQVDIFTKENSRPVGKIDKDFVRSTLKIPSEYYIKRGFTSEILDKFDVGLCTDVSKPMFMRVVVPVYDDSGLKMIGCVGRSMYEKCNKCNLWHSDDGPCPSNKYEELNSCKWRNSDGFKRNLTFYNIWNAKGPISRCNTAILVEGQGDIWRLEESDIKIGLGMFGCSFSEEQFDILNQIGVMNLILALDNDEAGLKGRETIRARYGRYFNIIDVESVSKDIGDTPIDEVKKMIIPIMERI